LDFAADLSDESYAGERCLRIRRAIATDGWNDNGRLLKHDRRLHSVIGVGATALRRITTGIVIPPVAASPQCCELSRRHLLSDSTIVSNNEAVALGEYEVQDGAD